MSALLLYILKSTICLTLFYLGFKALLSNDTFFRFNRWVLLGGIGICTLLPVVKIQTSQPLLIQQPIIQLEKIIAGNEPVAVSQAAIHTEVMSEPATNWLTNIDWGLLIGLSYLVGCLFCLIVTLLSFKRMFAMIRSGRRSQLHHYTLIITPTSVCPFSWGRYIILSEEDYEKYPDEIQMHEMMHLKFHHSADLLFVEIILLLHWFNPAAWLLKRELKDIHEYQADKGVLSQGIDATKYQLLLVKKAVGSSLYTLANSFNHSKIKKRITMMLKGKSNSWARLKLLLLVPLGLIVLNAFARPEVGRQLETFIQSKDKESPPNDQQNVREFFKTELDNYLKKAGASTSPDEITAFLKKNTNMCNLFINARGNLLLNNNHATIANLPDKLKELFTSSASSGKPVSVYFLIDINSPQADVTRTLGIVKEAFQKQQSTAGADKAPFLLFEDARNNKNFAVKDKVAQSSSRTTTTKVTKNDNDPYKDYPPPPPPPPSPDGTISFSYKSGKKDQGILFYNRHAKPGKGLEQRIDKIYSDDISTVTITIFKKADEGLLEGVQQILKNKIKYDVRYVVERKESLGS